MTETKLIPDTCGECILNHLLQKAVVLADMVLVLSKLDEVVYCLPIIREGDWYDSVFIIILWWIWAKNVRKFLDKDSLVLEEVKILVRVWLIDKWLKIV